MENRQIIYLFSVSNDVIFGLEISQGTERYKKQGNDNEEKLFLSFTFYIYKLLGSIPVPLCFFRGDL